MSGSKSQAWILGTAVVAVLILVGTWFLLVSPKQAEIQEANDANEDALFQQDQLRHRLLVLQDQFQDLEEYQADLDVIAAQIPPEPELADYVRSLQSAADQTGVVIVELAPATGVAFAELVGSAAQPAPTAEPTEAEGDAATDAATDTAETAEAAEDAADDAATDEPVAPAPDAGNAAAAAAGNGLVAIPVTMVVVGTYANTTAFLNQVQTQDGRLFLVTGLDALRQDAADNSGSGRPPTAAGDLELTITGILWQYVDPDAGPVVDEEGEGEGAATEPEPLPSTDRNPFASITG